jgi:hypothetical protein
LLIIREKGSIRGVKDKALVDENKKSQKSSWSTQKEKKETNLTNLYIVVKHLNGK